MRDMILMTELDDYIQGYSAGYTSVLGEMEEYAYSRDFPIIGPQVGRLLHLLTSMKKPENIFEMGSGFGYSTLWFALAAGRNCVIHHTDTDADNTERAKQYIEKSGVLPSIVYHKKDGIEALAGEGGKGERFDIIFCDIDKTGYPRAFREAKKYLHDGGVFIADNILWKGRVARRHEFSDDPDTKAIVEATEIFAGDPDYFTSILSVRDGVLVAMKR